MIESPVYLFCRYGILILLYTHYLQFCKPLTDAITILLINATVNIWCTLFKIYYTFVLQMEEQGNIEVHIEGMVDNHKLTPLDIDIDEVKEILVDIEAFLYPERNEKSKRPLISYRIEEGSAKHLFFLPITAALSFNGMIGEISSRNSIDFLDYKRAEIIEKFQKKAIAKNWEITITTSSSDKKILKINSATNYFNVAPDFIETEFYLYGEIYQEGGISPNLHITTKEYGKLTIAATKNQLTEGEKKLYRVYGVKVIGGKNLVENKLYDLKLTDYIEYNPVFNKNELNLLIKKAKPNLSKILNVDNWLDELRGGVVYE